MLRIAGNHAILDRTGLALAPFSDGHHVLQAITNGARPRGFDLARDPSQPVRLGSVGRVTADRPRRGEVSELPPRARRLRISLPGRSLRLPAPDAGNPSQARFSALRHLAHRLP